MKTSYLILLFFLLVLFNACKKDSNYSKSIVGTWELRQGSGSAGTFNYAAGNGHILRFTSTAYQMFDRGTLSKSGTYVLVADNSSSACQVLPNSQNKKIIYDNKNSDTVKVYVNITGNTLTYHVLGCLLADYNSNSVYEKQ